MTRTHPKLYLLNPRAWTSNPLSLNRQLRRSDLWSGGKDVWGWVDRQGTIKGLDLVDFNYPQHLEGKP